MIANILLIHADENFFYDVPENFWGYKFIKQAYDEDILKGMGKDSATGKIIFRPDDELTSAQFVTFIGRIYYFEEMKELEKESQKWYEPAFKLVKRHDLLQNTTSANSFHGKINRYEFVRILYNLMSDSGYQIPTESQLKGIYDKIADIEQVRKDGYEKEVAIAVYCKLISGVDTKGTFQGKSYLTRAQLSSFYAKSSDFKKQILQLKAQKNEASKHLENERKEQEKAKGNCNMSKEALEVLKLLNEERAKAQISTFDVDENLQKLANERGNELLQCFSHERPDKRCCFSIFDDYNINYTECGENIAAGQKKPEDVVKAWMNSPRHRDNILNPHFTHVGIGHVITSNAEYSVYWVLIFWAK